MLLAANTVITVGLRWNDPWTTSCNDYDLYLVQSSSGQIVAACTAFQDCPRGEVRHPLEVLSYAVPTTGTYFIQIIKYLASGNSRFDLITFGEPLEYQVAAGSLLHPADNASTGMATVGAVPWTSPTTIEPFSSLGPTTDNRIKPDLSAPDAVSTSTYGAGGFPGTSAASPHVAGAAALVKQANPGFSPAQIKSFLTGRAIDLGSAGPDNQFGAGRLNLGAPPTNGDFGVSCNPAGLNLTAGTSGTSTCTVQSTAGFADPVALDCTSQPAGVTCGFNPAAVTPPANGQATSTLTITVGSGVAPGT